MNFKIVFQKSVNKLIIKNNHQHNKKEITVTPSLTKPISSNAACSFSSTSLPKKGNMLDVNTCIMKNT